MKSNIWFFLKFLNLVDKAPTLYQSPFKERVHKVIFLEIFKQKYSLSIAGDFITFSWEELLYLTGILIIFSQLGMMIYQHLISNMDLLFSQMDCINPEPLILAINRISIVIITQCWMNNNIPISVFNWVAKRSKHAEIIKMILVIWMEIDI